MIHPGDTRITRTEQACPSLAVSLADNDLPAVGLAQWALVLVALLAIGVAGLWAWESREEERQAGEYEAAVQRLQDTNRRFVAQAREAGIELSEARVPALIREVSFSNHLVDRRGFSWTRLLADLEEAVPPRVSINSVALNFTERRITLNGQAQSLKTLTDLMTGLERHRAFDNVTLAQHRSTERRHGRSPGGVEDAIGQAVAFTLTVGYQQPPS